MKILIVSSGAFYFMVFNEPFAKINNASKLYLIKRHAYGVR